jgi:hypothetical protein
MRRSNSACTERTARHPPGGIFGFSLRSDHVWFTPRIGLPISGVFPFLQMRGRPRDQEDQPVFVLNLFYWPGVWGRAALGFEFTARLRSRSWCLYPDSHSLPDYA